MHLLIVGTGYVGLVSGTCFAEMGHTVTCLDHNADIIAGLEQGRIPIYEPGLEEMLKRNVAAGRLRFTTDYSSGVRNAEICFIAVNTPPQPDGSADLSAVQAAARSIAQVMDGYRIIVNKSTVPVGTAALVTQTIALTLSDRGVDCDFDVCSNPEFLKEGNAINDCMKPDRVIIGADHPRVAAQVKTIYNAFMLSHERLIVVDTRSAEMIKYASNAMLATRISFMNELASLCETTGADISLVRQGMGADQRIGRAFLYAGMGYGGSCFPKDVQALCSMGRANQKPMQILEAVEAVNQRQKHLITHKITHYYGGKEALHYKTVGILGLAFKPDTDDMREAPSRTLIQDLVTLGAQVRVYDPIAMPNAQRSIPSSDQITWCADEYETAEGADSLVLCTEWKQFRCLDFRRLCSLMRGHAFFDGRNQYDFTTMRQYGFDYICIGRQASVTESEAAYALHEEHHP